MIPSTLNQYHTHQSKSLRSHIIFLCLLLSIAAVYLNVIHNRNEIEIHGITTWLTGYMIFGILGCVVFALVLMFVLAMIYGACSRWLDVVPGLGTAIWTVACTLLILHVIPDQGFKMTAHNVPLFAILFANGWIALNVLGTGEKLPFRRAVYRCTNGSMDFGYIDETYETFYKISQFDVFPEEGRACFRNLCVTASDFINGRNLETFRDSFSCWERDARHFVSRLYRRRLLCLVGFIVEAVGVFVVVALIGFFYSSPEWSRSSTSMQRMSTSDYDLATTTQNTLALRESSLRGFFSKAFNLSHFQIAISLLLSACSHYLWVMLRVQHTLTSDMERAAWILCRVLAHQQSQLDGENPGHEREKRWKLASEKHPVPAFLLPALGIARDVDESLRCGRIVMKSEQSGAKYKLSLAEEGKYICHEYARTGEIEEIVTPETPGEFLELQVEAVVM